MIAPARPQDREGVAPRQGSSSPARVEPAYVAFVLEQVLGHVSLSQNIKRFAAADRAVVTRFVDVTFHREEGWIERLPLPGYLKGALRARLEIRAALGGRMPDAFFLNTQKPALLCPDYVRARPSIISLDVTPRQYDALSGHYGHVADRPGPVAAAKHRWNRMLFHSARRLLPWSNWAAQSLMDDYGVPQERITVIPPGADTERWRPAGRPAGGPVRLLFVGGNFARKGGNLLLDWFRTSPDAAGCELHLVTRDRLTSSPGVRVYNDMQNNGDALVRLAQSSDVFVLPTLGDCFSIASVEAMAAGLPVVTTAVGGIPDIIRHGENGFLIPADDTRALAYSLGSLVRDAELRGRFGRSARCVAVERFDARKNVARIMDEMRAVLDSR